MIESSQLDRITSLTNNSYNKIIITTQQTYSPNMLNTLSNKLIDSGELHAINTSADIKLDSALTYAGFINVHTIH